MTKAKSRSERSAITLAESPRKQRLLYFLGGAIFTSICGVIQLKWMDIVPYAAFDQQPAWLKGTKGLVGGLPWIALAAVIVFRFMKGRHIRAGFYFMGTVVPVGLLLGWLFLGPSLDDYRYRQSFDAALWRNQEKVEKDTKWPPRLCMVDDLLQKHQFKGMDREQVVALIGKPDKTESFRDWDFVYLLGPERGWFSIDSEWLVFRFDNQKKVTEYKIVTD